MLWYFAAVFFHVVAVLLWIGVMSYWVMIVRPAGQRSRYAAVALEAAPLARLGWLCFVVALVTGGFLLYAQGVSVADVSSGWLFHGQFGQVLRAKLILVAMLVVLQLLVQRRSATVRWLLLAVGLAVVGVSTFLIR